MPGPAGPRRAYPFSGTSARSVSSAQRRIVIAVNIERAVDRCPSASRGLPAEAEVTARGLRIHPERPGERQRLAKEALASLEVRMVGTGRDISQEPQRADLGASLAVGVGQVQSALRLHAGVVQATGEPVGLA